MSKNTDNIKPISIDDALNPRSPLHGATFTPSGKFTDNVSVSHYYDETVDQLFIKVSYFEPHTGFKSGMLIPMHKEDLFDDEYVLERGQKYRQLKPISRK